MGWHEVERPQDLGAVIVGLREEQGLTQEELAERLGFSRSYLSDLESGRITIQVARLLRTLRSLGATVGVWVDPKQERDD